MGREATKARRGDLEPADDSTGLSRGAERAVEVRRITHHREAYSLVEGIAKKHGSSVALVNVDAHNDDIYLVRDNEDYQIKDGNWVYWAYCNGLTDPSIWIKPRWEVNRWLERFRPHRIHSLHKKNHDYTYWKRESELPIIDSPCVVSIDLDYFACLAPQGSYIGRYVDDYPQHNLYPGGELSQAVNELLQFLRRIKDLRMIILCDSPGWTPPAQIGVIRSFLSEAITEYLRTADLVWNEWQAKSIKDPGIKAPRSCL